MEGIVMFESEDEFQAFFIRNFGLAYLGNWLYATITKIAGEFIQPEIDLLDITPIEPVQVISAFEFKVLKSEKIGSNYRSIYAGIGQALSYFRYGVDLSYFVIGISDNIPPENARELRGNIRLIGDFVNRPGINRFQIKMYDEFLNELWEIPDLHPTGRFERGGIPRGFLEPIELARDNILALNFPKRKSNNFFRRHKLDQYLL
jgi:hypothetical protein